MKADFLGMTFFGLLADAPKAMEMPVFLWHEARCAGAEDLEGGAEDFGGASAA